MFQAVLSNVRSFYVSSFNWTWSRLPSLGFTSLFKSVYRQVVQNPTPLVDQDRPVVPIPLVDQNRPVEQPPLQEELIGPLRWINIASDPECELFCPKGTTLQNFTEWQPDLDWNSGYDVNGKKCFKPILITVYDKDGQANRCQLISMFRLGGIEYCRSLSADHMLLKNEMALRIGEIKLTGPRFRRILGAVNSINNQPAFRGDQRIRIRSLDFKEISYAVHGYFKLTAQQINNIFMVDMMGIFLPDQYLKKPGMISIMDTINRLSEGCKDFISGGSRSELFQQYATAFLRAEHSLTLMLSEWLDGEGGTVWSTRLERSLQFQLDRVQTLYLANQQVFTQVPVTATGRIDKLNRYTELLTEVTFG